VGKLAVTKFLYTGLVAAVAIPLALLSATSLLDTPWAVAVERAMKVAPIPYIWCQVFFLSGSVLKILAPARSHMHLLETSPRLPVHLLAGTWMILIEHISTLSATCNCWRTC